MLTSRLAGYLPSLHEPPPSLPPPGAFRGQEPRPSRRGPRTGEPGHPRAGHRVLLQHRAGRSAPWSRRAGPHLAPGRDLRAGRVWETVLPGNGRPGAGGGTAHELHHGLVHQRRRRLPRACGLTAIRRIERSRRYRLTVDRSLSDEEISAFLGLVHDRMTECRYPRPLESFATGVRPEAAFTIPVLAQGRAALERINREMGLAFDDWDLDYYTALFRDRVGRDPTNVECFDIAQSNSEHSRHWFFKGRLVVDGKEVPGHLLALVKGTLDANPTNSVIAFRDNSSAIRGYAVRTILPAGSNQPGPFRPADVEYHVIFTAETHNFPSGVAPFPGAETGSGGRIRDVHATGRGGLVRIGISIGPPKVELGERTVQEA
ncbi:MAG: hypothetical protein HYT81_12090 [Gemmatimonadetes bacterium]|nr:hypothetical protein [Gemmatimonadota bacterium]